jgi:O-antigen/teichoic acid export membrane protein
VVATLGATHYAAVTALLPVVAEMSGRAESDGAEPSRGADPTRLQAPVPPETRAEVLGVVQRAARFSAMFVVAVTVPLVVAAHVVLQIWVGGDYADGATGPLRLLLLASVVRFTGAVLSQAYFGLGDRWPVTIAITVEAVVNLSASLVLAQRYGAPGVALGTVIGAVAGVATAFVLARSRPLGYALPMAVVRGTVRPVLGFVPLLLTSPWWYGWERLGAAGTTAVALIGVAATYLWLLTCLTASDRIRLRALLHR